MKTALALAALFALATPIAFAQGATPGASPSAPTVAADPIPTKFWKASLPGGEYMVALGRISSIAKHTYVVDGAARVHEVTVADVSSAIARFYYLEPVTDKSPLAAGQVVLDRLRTAAEEATARAGQQDAWSQVVKNYPATTHAKTLEFRLQYKDNLDSLYSSVSRAWERGNGERFSVKNEE